MKNIHGSCFSNRLQNSIDGQTIKDNNVFYPGKMRKFGTDLWGERYIIKIADSPSDILRLYAEQMGGLLCRQLQIETSEIRLISFEGSLALLSKSWLNKGNEQYFSLASYYEELLDTFGKDVIYSYAFFKYIVKNHCPRFYEHILDVFWQVFIIDYLLCNDRHAGNWGFIDDGTVRLAPIYDCATRLDGIDDYSWQCLTFPSLKMQYISGCNSAYDILKQLEDLHKDKALNDIKSILRINFSQCHSIEEEFLNKVVSFRFKELFRI